MSQIDQYPLMKITRKLVAIEPKDKSSPQSNVTSQIEKKTTSENLRFEGAPPPLQEPAEVVLGVWLECARGIPHLLSS